MSIIAGVPRWPNLFIVGAPKGGTTTLWRYLDQHPDVFMSPEKEPNFFLDPTPPVRVPTEEAISASSPARRRGLARRGERPVLLGSDDTRLIRARVPDARIMIALRDPVERAYSSYWHDVKFGVESRPFARSWTSSSTARAACGHGPGQEARLPRLLLAARCAVPRRIRGCRARRLPEDLHADPISEAASIFEFLGVDPDVARQISPGTYNVFAQPRNRLAARLMASPRARAGGRAVFPEHVAHLGREPRAATRPQAAARPALRGAQPRSRPIATRSSCSAEPCPGS